MELTQKPWYIILWNLVLTGDNNEFAEKQPPGEGSVGDGGQEIKTIGTIIESY